MNNLFARAFFFTIFLLIEVALYAQSESISVEAIKRNDVYISLGLFPMASLNYERNVMQFPKSYLNVKMGIGYWADFAGDAGILYSPLLVYLSGKRKSHLEIDLGASLLTKSSMYEDKMDKSLIMEAFAGYRFEKPDGGFVFRVGGTTYPLGDLELFIVPVISLGFKF